MTHCSRTEKRREEKRRKEKRREEKRREEQRREDRRTHEVRVENDDRQRQEDCKYCPRVRDVVQQKCEDPKDVRQRHGK